MASLKVDEMAAMSAQQRVGSLDDRTAALLVDHSDQMLGQT